MVNELIVLMVFLALMTFGFYIGYLTGKDAQRKIDEKLESMEQSHGKTVNGKQIRDLE